MDSGRPLTNFDLYKMEARRDARRSLFSGLLFIILAGVLFFIHWRWLKGITSAPATP